MEGTPRHCLRLESAYGQRDGRKRVLKAWQGRAVVYLSPHAVTPQIGLLLVSEPLEEQMAIPFAVLHIAAQASTAVTSMLPPLKSLFFSTSLTTTFALVTVAASCWSQEGSQWQPSQEPGRQASGTKESLNCEKGVIFRPL